MFAFWLFLISGILAVEGSGSCGSTFSIQQVNHSSLFVQWTHTVNNNSSSLLLEYGRSDSCNGSSQEEFTTNVTSLVDRTNYTLIGLEAGTCYKIRLSYKTTTESCTTDAKIGKTKDKEPSGRVQNLTAITLSANAIQLVWKPMKASEQNGIITSYKIHVSWASDERNVTVPSNVTVYNVTGLEAYKNYSFAVSGVNSAGSGPNEIVFQFTLEAKPSGRVQNLTAITLSANAIQLVWKPMKASEQNGIITSYKIHVSWASDERNVTVPSNVTVYNVTGLEAYKNYSFAVSGVNSAGSGPNEIVFQFTLEAKPAGKVRNLTATAYSDDTVRLSWIPLNDSERNGMITAYHIKVLGGTSEKNFSVLSNVTVFNVTGLKAYRNYSFGVSAINSAGSGPYRVVFEMTFEAIPGAPRAPHFRNVTSRSAIVDWEYPLEANGVLTDFLLFYGSDVYWKSKIFNATARTTFLGNLNPFTNYTLKIQAATQVGWGPNSTESEFRTEEEAPGSAPLDIKARNITSTALEVSWNPPLVKDRNGRIRLYKLRYREVLCLGIEVRPTTAPTQEPVSNTGTERSSETTTTTEKPVQQEPVIEKWNTTAVIVPQLAYNITNLSSPWTCVDVQIAAVTIADGPYSSVLRLRSDEDVPGQPEALQARNISSSEVMLTWKEPSRTNGYITKYQVVYGFQGGAEKVLTYSGLELSGNLTGLEPYTVYKVGVRAATSKGFGDEAQLSMLTDEDVPSQPLKVQAFNLSSTVVLLSWDLPSKVNGIIRGYLLKFKQLSPLGDGASSFQERDILHSDRNFTVTGLEIFSVYRMELSAKTTKGYGKAAVIVVKSDQDVPLPPEGLIVKNQSAFHVFLQWNLQSDQRGIIQGHKLKICKFSPLPDVSCEPRFNLTATATFFNFTKATPYTNYTFSLSAATIKGEGNASVVSTRTNEYVPSPVRNVTIANVAATSFVVSWLPPLSPNGEVHYRINYWRVLDPDKVFGRETKDLKLSLTKLEEYQEYIITLQPFTKSGGNGSIFKERVSTAPAVPSGPPLNVAALPTSSTTANVTWDHPEVLERNGEILDYYVVYNTSDNMKTLKVGSNDTRITLTGLKKYATYSINVSAVNVKGEGPPGFATFQTKQDIPGAVSFSSCVNMSKSSLRVSWNAPVEPNGEITGYNLTWKYVEKWPTSTEIYSYKLVSAEETTAELTRLEIYSRYNITVAAQTESGWGPSTVITCRTGESEPNRPSRVWIESSTAKSLFIKWLPPERENGVLTGYKVEGWGTVGEPFRKELSGTSVQSYEILELKPYTNYTIGVSARTSVGYGSATTVEGRTNESIPSEVKFVIYDVTKSAVRFSWTAPSEKNGDLGYRVYYRIALPPLPKYKLYMETRETKALVKNLEEFVDYHFKIVPFTGAGEGPSVQQNITTSASSPSGPPQNFTAVSVASTFVSLSWKLPSFFERNGIIIGYRLSMFHPLVEEKDIEHLTYNWTGLDEYQIYSFSVQAKTVSGLGPPANLTVLTSEDKPGKPRLQGYENLSSTEMRINWLPPIPEDLNGIITFYQLRLLEHSSTELTDAKEYSNETTSATFKSLKKYTLYQVELRAATSKGLGPADNAMYRTKDDKPDGPPRNVKIKGKNSTTVTLEWLPPSKPNGIIKYYNVRFKRTSESIRITKSIKSSPGTVNGLKPNEVYDFEVSCQSSGGEGPYSERIDIKTEIDRPPRPTGIVVQPTITPSFNSFAIRLWKGSDDHGQIKYYMVIVLELRTDKNGAPIKPTRSPSSYAMSELFTYAQYRELKESTGKIYPYVAGVIERSKFPVDSIFKVGDGTASTKVAIRRKRRAVQGYYNGELDPSSSYMVFERAFVTSELYTSGDWTGPFITTPKPTEPPTSSGGAIAGAVVGVILIVFVILAGLYYIRRRGYFKKEKPPVVEGEDIALSNVGCDNTGFDGDYRPRATAVKVENFPAHYQRLNKDGKFLFAEEFKLIRNGEDCTSEHSDHPINKEKNRYTNIVAYDHTRVKLEPFDETPESDYINANFIDGYSRKKEYIATQGPLEHTIEDFWRMIWEQDTTIIVMLTRLEENGRVKCALYWPEAGTSRFGCMQITTVESVERPDYCMRTFSVINNLFPSKEKFVKQFHFLAWPDHGVPSSQAILSFLRRVRAATAPHGGPTLVHCSAGVGRTGTYIVLDVNLHRMAEDGAIEIFNFLRHIRTQRNFMVQTESQYVFIHDALMEYINCGSTEVQVKEIREYVRKLQRTVSGSDDLGIDKEFAKLNAYDRSIQKSFAAASMISNKTKNRFLNVLPFDDTRVCLTMNPGVQGSDYINASFVDGYSEQKLFIATQAPLPSTIPDFWRLVWEQHSTAIVCLVQESDNAKVVRVHRYWPLLESAMHGYFIIEQLSEKKLTDLIIRDLKITHTQEGLSRVVRQFHFVGWPDNSMPDNGSSLIEVIGQLQKWQESTGNHAVVVHCSTGVGRTGVFIAAFNMIERVRSEGVVDVFQTVRKLRTMRPAMVQTKAQYLFCYVILQDYLASFDLHASLM